MIANDVYTIYKCSASINNLHSYIFNWLISRRNKHVVKDHFCTQSDIHPYNTRTGSHCIRYFFCFDILL